MILTRESFLKVEYIDEAPAYAERIRSAREFAGDLAELLYTPAAERVQGLLPWPGTHERIQFRPQEVTLWLGINGHGKSLVTSIAALEFAAKGQRVCLASMEMAPKATLKRMLLQAVARATPNRATLDSFLAWADPMVYIYDQMGSVDRKELLAAIRYSAKNLNVEHFFIDSLLKCGIREDDHDAQKEFIEQLCTVARDFHIHVHLIHHSKKKEDEFSPPGKFDARGSGTITDQVDQVITVFRNKRKELDREADDDKADAMLFVNKNRHGGWEGVVPLWFIPTIGVYCEDRRRIPPRYDVVSVVDALDYRAGRH